MFAVRSKFMSTAALSRRMSYLLHVKASPMGEYSTSNKIADAFIDTYKAQNADAKVVVRDLSVGNIAHLDSDLLSYGAVPEESRTEAMKTKHQERLALIKEIAEAKSILITTPMWNWGPPSTLKAYIDNLFLVGELDPYTNKKLENKKVFVGIACGGTYSTDLFKVRDFESEYLKLIFELLGGEVTVARAEYSPIGSNPINPASVDLHKQSLADAIASAQQVAKSL